MKVLHNESNKTLVKEILKKTLINGVTSHRNQQIQINPYQNPKELFAEIKKNSCGIKFIWNFKEPQTAKTILKKINKVGGLALPNFKNYHQVTINKNIVVPA